MKFIWDFLAKIFEAFKQSKPATAPAKPDLELPSKDIIEQTTAANPNWSYIAKIIKLDDDSSKLSELSAIAQKIYNSRQMYFAVEKATGVPAKLIAAIHYMESSLNFKTILHNGTPLGQVSKIVPVGVKFDDWTEAAIDALKSEGCAKIKEWDFATQLAFAEKYNGLGYRKHGVYSNYVCAYTNFSNEVGRYVADGQWDSMSKQNRPGVAAIILILNQLEARYSGTAPTPVEEVGQDLKWMTIAKKEIGQHEISGASHNARIVEYHQQTTLKSTTDEVPWCAAFVSWVFVKSSMMSKRSARAKDWLEWGTVIDKPRYGCVVIFTRDGGGHVAFYVSETDTHVNVLGGNQSNSVCIDKYPKANIVGYRYPVDL